MYQPPTTGVSVDPIISRLRPRTVSEILDQAFRLYRKNFLTFIAILAVVHIPVQLIILASTLFVVGDTDSLQASLQQDTFSSSDVNRLFSYLGVIFVVSLGVSLLGRLVQKLSEGALTAGVADSHLDRPVTFGSSYRQMLQRIGPMLGLILLEMLINIAVFIPIILLILFGFGLALGDSTSGAGSGLLCFGCVLFIPAAVALIYLTIRLTITTPALIIEKLGPVQAVRRSWGLIQNFWMRTLALQLVLLVLGWIVQLGPGSIVSAIVSLFAPQDLILREVISGFVTTLTTLVYLPIQLIAITLYYFDLRVRKEGYDLETALTQRYASPQPPPGYGGGYGGYGGYGQTQPVGGYGETQPTGGYSPPQLGTETQSQSYGYGAYTTPIPEQPSQEPISTDYTPPETPRQPQPDAPEQP